ncbi:hypothetical protein FSP39_002464 [Pinctada imbricata]|uniref:RNA helicase n=1 Tax=Pinctada imbricata TaxID=66713 RepID=A0AA88XYW8_PINIB|nr:hypothetical protein FSP39_002464 [Pinctada imbricata]
MKIIDEHFKTHRRKKHPKVIFLTEQGALAQQQGDQMEKYLKHSVKVITGESQRQESFSSIKEWVKRRDILVVTAQLLVNAIIEHDVEIQEFSLMVFDECHHAHAKHSYNQIMFSYLDLKLDEKCHASLPQIIGLTASVGVGKARRLENAVDWIKSMMANLDAEEIQTVSKENERELMSHAQVPKETLLEVPSRRNDRFRSVIVQMMGSTENMMKESEFLPKVAQTAKVTQPPIQKGSEQYIQWMFNRTLIIYDYARVKDAIEFLKAELRKWQQGDQHDKTEKTMKEYLEKTLPILNECQDDDNPKLTKLKESIDRAFYDQEESRGIVFVKTRDLVSAIVSWMKDTRGLKELKPAAFVGTHAPGDEGLTKAEQDNILQLFRQGGHKMIVATSVADEGLDIQECNLVIKYHQVTNEIAMVQRRGRARKKESQVILFHAAGSGIAEKEELNMLREVMMNKAIDALRKDMEESSHSFQNEILSLQRRDKAKRELEAKTRNGRMHKEGEFELTCGKCREFICFSDEMRLIQRAHHAAICEDLTERIKAEVNPKPAYQDNKLMSGVGKVLCRNCGYDLGNVSVYDNAQFAILKISNFSVMDVRGNFNVFRRWKQVPFYVKDITEEEVEDRLKGEKYIEMM